MHKRQALQRDSPCPDGSGCRRCGGEKPGSEGFDLRGVLEVGRVDEVIGELGAERDVRVQRAKTMHEKFGVMGDDVFFGSANFSSSSSTKHSENRISVKNEAGTAKAFQARFEEMWNKSRIV